MPGEDFLFIDSGIKNKNKQVRMTTLETDRDKLRRAAALAFRHTADGMMPLARKLRDEQENARQLAARLGALSEMLTLLDETAAATETMKARSLIAASMRPISEARAILTDSFLP